MMDWQKYGEQPPISELQAVERLYRIVDKLEAERAKLYPQPDWCGYPEAVCGEMGCWSLVYHKVTGEEYCKNCELYRGKEKK